MNGSAGDNQEDTIAGILLGTALGDALGLPCEGLDAATIRKHYAPIREFRFLSNIGFVSDDTEQSALVAQSILRGDGDLSAIRRHFRWAMLGWFLRLPWGIGWSTLRACLKIAIGLKNSGLRSAGNGAAMRSAIIGGFVPDDAAVRRMLATELAEVTHTDPRGVAGACFVADLSAACVRQQHGDRAQCFMEALELVDESELKDRLKKAHEYSVSDSGVESAAESTAESTAESVADSIGTGGFVLESVPLAAYCFLRFEDPLDCLGHCIALGGDTDTNAAILGGWLGALHGASGLPQRLLAQLQGGPFGERHLRRLASAIATGQRAPRYLWPLAMLRNLALYPVVLAHGFRRLAWYLRGV